MPERIATSLKVRVIPAGQLGACHVAAWSRLQRSDPALASPFFRPEFTLAMAAVRGDVYVATWEHASEPIGFLPFERAGGAGKPVGSHINEVQGAIARGDLAWSPREVVRAAGLRSWNFDHVAVTQECLAPYISVVADSPYMDLSQGFERYFNSRGHSWSKKLRQKERKAVRELGEVRLEVEPANRHALRTLLAWKAEQCRRTHRPCAYNVKWVVKSFERLLDHLTDDFSGLLFSLYFGRRLAAAEFDISSRSVMHGIVSGYDRELSQYAPGLLLTVRVAQAASNRGIARIDLGKGAERYKSELASASDLVGEGAVHSQSLLEPLSRVWIRAKDRLRSTRLQSVVWQVRRWITATRTLLNNVD